MRYIQSGYQGVSLLMGLNADRFIMLGAVGGALLVGAFMGSL